MIEKPLERFGIDKACRPDAFTLKAGNEAMNLAPVGPGHDGRSGPQTSCVNPYPWGGWYAMS